MELLTKDQISSTIKKIKPSIVVVAYIGADWKDYIDPALIEKIVIAPTLGSNPYGIESLKKALGGWKKIGFLDNLHAKLYLGKDSAVIGSPNLSRNALGEGGLEELAVKTNDKTVISGCNTFASAVWQEAQQAYPSDKAKNNQLQWLKDARSTMSKAIEKNAPPFSDYDYSKNKIYPVWWTDDDDVGLNHKAEGMNDVPADTEDMYFAIDDEISPDVKWMLCYRLDKNEKATKQISWLYKTRFVINGTNDKDYPNAWLEFHFSGDIRRPTPPFKINDKYFKEAFTKVINSGKYEPLLNKQPGDIWYVKNTTSLLPRFFKEVQQEYAKLISEKNHD